MMQKTFSVKIQNIEVDDLGMGHTRTESLGENLSWQDAIELRKANKGAYIHPENRVYPEKKKRTKKTKTVIE